MFTSLFLSGWVSELILQIQTYTYIIFRSQSYVFIWDIQTGVSIKKVYTGIPGKIAFHGDQRTFTITWDSRVYTYDGLNGTLQCQTKLLLSSFNQQGACWAYKDTLQLATTSEADGKLVINIVEFQKTSDPPLPVVESFLIPPQHGAFSFCPVSFHASFVTEHEIIILNVQDSKTLLSTQVAQQLHTQSNHFSPDGHFFACGTSEGRICIWKNTPVSYVPWSTLQPQFPFNRFSFSPTAISILAWGPTGIQLLHPENSASSQSPNETKPHSQYENHLVACSTDGKHIVIAQQKDNVVTVFDPLFGTPLWTIQVGVVIQDIKVVGNVLFVTDSHGLFSWNLGAGEIGYHTGGATVYDNIGIAHDADNLVLSNGCSHIAFSVGRTVFLYDIQAQETLVEYVMDGMVTNIQFSQDGCWLGIFSNIEGSNRDTDIYFTTLKMVEDWHLVDVTTKLLADKWSWTSVFRSPYGYRIGSTSEWVTDSKDNHILWLPPNWRTKHGLDVSWDGDFLALVGSHHKRPIIIELQPLPHLYLHQAHLPGIWPPNPIPHKIFQPKKIWCCGLF